MGEWWVGGWVGGLHARRINALTLSSSTEIVIASFNHPPTHPTQAHSSSFEPPRHPLPSHTPTHPPTHLPTHLPVESMP